MAHYYYNEIRKVHLELSSLCNAECPLCPRNLNGYPYNDGYVERNLSLDEVKKILQPSFLKQLNEILINGNFGDFVMNPDSVPIVEYFYNENPNLVISISTNGSARNREFWQSLARLNAQVHFCIDGLDDTHSLYRKNTVFSTVIKNAQTFIEAGGLAWWKMLIFDHNRHQVEDCRKLSEQMNFANFFTIPTYRNTGPVFDKQGNYLYSIGPAEKIKSVDSLIQTKKISFTNLPAWDQRTVKPTIDCDVVKDQSIYISSTGEVYPCCYIGFQPNTYGHGNFTEVANRQVNQLIKENNALEYDLEHCIRWFSGVVNSWQVPTFDQGRLYHCNENCGRC